MHVIGCGNLFPFSPGSIYLFKGDSYWKFMFPGSSPLDGYPRSSAADWLDCTDSSSSSPVLDDFSLSFSPPAGRQELRERWREQREKEEAAAGRRRGRHGDIYKDGGSHIWTKCSCQNGALGSRMAFFNAALLLITCTLLAV